MPTPPHLIDTNILLRLTQPGSPDYKSIRASMDSLWQAGADLLYAPQNLVEFWNVCTRPLAKNGFGLSIAETHTEASLIEGQFRLIPDSEATHREWRRLVVEAGVHGVQVHDAHLVATMRSYNVSHILTLNGRDFRRYSGIHAVSPEDVLSSRL